MLVDDFFSQSCHIYTKPYPAIYSFHQQMSICVKDKLEKPSKLHSLPCKMCTTFVAWPAGMGAAQTKSMVKKLLSASRRIGLEIPPIVPNWPQFWQKSMPRVPNDPPWVGGVPPWHAMPMGSSRTLKSLFEAQSNNVLTRVSRQFISCHFPTLGST